MGRSDTPATPLLLKLQSGGCKQSALFKWHCSISIRLFLREFGRIQVVGFLLLDTLSGLPLSGFVGARTAVPPGRRSNVNRCDLRLSHRFNDCYRHAQARRS